MSKKRQGPGFHLLSHSAHLVDEQVRKSLEHLGIHAGQARVLDALNRMGSASQRLLASEFNVSAASMSEMTKRLISNGFIEVQKDPADARASVLSLTEQGAELLSQVFAAWDDVDRIIVDAIGQDKAEELFGLSLTLRNALGGRAAGSARKPEDAKKPG